ncbi:MAG: PAS domain S-box protein, partial [Euryarchaeota archaeon]|nr:PAS domain S-box protein [Euryarchaeota archaeon]
MKDNDKTQEQLIKELAQLRRRIAELEQSKIERNRAEEALRESEETFRALAENANDGILIAIGKVVYAYANKRASEITGYSVAELLKSTIKELVHPDELEKIMERYRKRLAAQPIPSQYETIIIRKDGMSVPIEVTAAKTVWRGQPADLVIVRDITERKRAEDDVKVREDFLQKVIEQSPNAMWISDEHGTVIRMNQALRDLLEITDEEIIGKYNVLRDIQVIQQGFLPLVKSVFEEGKTVNFVIDYYTEKEKQVKLEHKTHKVLQIVLSAIKNKDGKIVNAICQHRDITERKQAEEALQQERNLVNRIMETSPAAITMVDRQGKITFANTRAEKILGLTKDDITQRSYNTPAWHITDYEGNPFPDDQLPFQQVMRTGKPVFDVCHAIEWPDGRRVLLSINGAPLRDESGQIDGVVFSIEDITERKKVEERLRESEERYKTLFDEALVGICLADAETGIIIDCNEALAALVCRERAELIGRPQKILHPPQDNKKALSPTFRQHLTDKEGLILETQVVTRTGDIREVEIKANLLDLHGRKVLQGLFHDITDRKRAEKALRESEERFRLAFENANTGVCLVDLEGNLTRVNSKMCEIFGYTKEELERMTVNDIAHPEDIDKSPEFIKKTLRGERDRGTFEKRYFHKKGQVVTCQVSSSLVRDAEGAPLYFISHLHDITDRKQAEAQIVRALRETRVRLEVSQVLAGAQTEDEVLDALIQHAGLSPQSYVAILTFDRTEQEPTIILRRRDPFESGVWTVVPIGTRFPASRFPMMNLYSANQLFVSEDVMFDERVDPASRE